MRFLGGYTRRTFAESACWLALVISPQASAEEPPSAGAERPLSAAQRPYAPGAQPRHEAQYTLVRLRGKVVYQAEALRRLHGVETDDDASQSAIVLETAKGELHPIIKDARGRAFFLDKRLRNRELELLACRYPGSPAVQVVRVYAIEDGKRFELDYWCDICSIPMYELKECECCQGPIRIRLRPVNEAGDPEPR